MKESVQNLFRNVIVSGKKFVAGANLIALTIAGSGCATAQSYRDSDGECVGPIRTSRLEVTSLEQYGNQDYHTCYIGDPYHKEEDVIIDDYPITFIFKQCISSCVSAKYYIDKSAQNADIVRFQCDDKGDVIQMTYYNKGIVNKNNVCEAIKKQYMFFPCR